MIGVVAQRLGVRVSPRARPCLRVRSNQMDCSVCRSACGLTRREKNPASAEGWRALSRETRVISTGRRVRAVLVCIRVTACSPAMLKHAIVLRPWQGLWSNFAVGGARTCGSNRGSSSSPDKPLGDDVARRGSHTTRRLNATASPEPSQDVHFHRFRGSRHLHRLPRRAPGTRPAHLPPPRPRWRAHRSMTFSGFQGFGTR